jgi:hypothetical protein
VDQSRAERAQELIIRGKAADDRLQQFANYRKALGIAREIGDEALQLNLLDRLIATSPSLARALDLWPEHWALAPPTSNWMSRFRKTIHLVTLLRDDGLMGLLGSIFIWALTFLTFAGGISPVVAAAVIGAAALVLRTYSLGARAFIAFPLVYWILFILGTIFMNALLPWRVGLALVLILFLFTFYRWERPKFMRLFRPLSALLHPLSYRRVPAIVPFDDTADGPNSM